MKLAPPQNTLQPLPTNVQPAVSQNVERNASPTDLQTIQTAQAAQQNAGTSAQPSNPLPVTPYAPMPSSDSIALSVAFAAAIVIAGAVVWLWRSF